MGIDAQIAYITNGYGKVQHLEEINVDMGRKKMRLIDKDSLLELIKDLEVTYQEDLDRFKDEELTNPQRYRDTQRGRIEGVIDCYIDAYNAEEIKAIPVEWIRNYVSIWISEPYKNFALNMINVWEKENDRD